MGRRCGFARPSGRPLTFDDVVVRVSDGFVAEMHIDTDEGNAAGIKDGDLVEILSQLSSARSAAALRAAPVPAHRSRI